MKLLYLGCFVEPSQEPFIEKQAKAVVTISTTTFQRAFLSGFENESLKPDIINAPDIGSWPQRCKRIYIPKSHSDYYGMDCENVGYCNITYIKRYSILSSLKRRLHFWVKQHLDETVVIVVYGLTFSYLKAAMDMKKEYSNVRICCIVLDLPEYFGDNNSLLYKLFGDSSKKTYTIAKDIDSYVLLTEYMKDPLQVGDKPWLLMEGLYAPRPIIPTKKHPKTILYTGKLDARFGIRDLVDNFIKLKGDDYWLWICGSGVDSKYVEEKAQECERIIFYGQVKQERVIEMQREASLLINPRKPEGEYTKYSFPSKTMEYMASGTPTLMYHLPGMPKDYEDKVVLFKDSSSKTFCETLEKWMNKSQDDLNKFGAIAREFILDNKTAEKQVARFIGFIKDNYGE